MSKRKNKLNGIINNQRSKASDIDSLKNKAAYKSLSSAILRTVVLDGYIQFFEKNDLADVIIELAEVSKELIYRETKKNAEKKELQDQEKRASNRWKDEELEKYFQGDLSIQEIAALTHMSINNLYYRCKKNPAFRFKVVKGANTRQKIDFEKLKNWKAANGL